MRSLLVSVNFTLYLSGFSVTFLTFTCVENVDKASSLNSLITLRHVSLLSMTFVASQDL